MAYILCSVWWSTTVELILKISFVFSIVIMHALFDHIFYIYVVNEFGIYVHGNMIFGVVQFEVFLQANG